MSIANATAVSRGSAVDRRWSKVHAAASYQDVDALRDLLRGGASPNVQDAFGQTPLHIAVDREMDAWKQAGEEPSTVAVELLLAYGADADLPDDAGSSARDWAARNGFLAATQLFGST